MPTPDWLLLAIALRVEPELTPAAVDIDMAIDSQGSYTLTGFEDAIHEIHAIAQRARTLGRQ